MGTITRIRNVRRKVDYTKYSLVSLNYYHRQHWYLMVELTDGKWVSATPIPGSIVVNTGDLLEKWTGGYFPATKHRVIIPSTELKQRLPRYSIAYFLAPDNETLVAPITDSTICQTNNEIYNKRITAYEHIMNRVKNTEN